MRKTDRLATIRDVAALAGVSVGTASKALNGRGSLRAETRERVRAAAERLGFEANVAARTLKAGRTYTVGMITTDSIGRFSIPLMLGAEDALGAGQMSVLLCDARDDAIREQYYLRTLLTRRVDGIIVTGRRAQARPPLGANLPVPVVYAFISSTDPGDCSVVPDEAGGATKAVEHLVAIGRRRIAHVTGPEHHASARLRAEATASALVRPPLFGEWSEAWGRQAAGLLLADSAPSGDFGAPSGDFRAPAGDLGFDAVFAGSDQIARGVVDTLRAAGRRVPEDVAVIGFDNWDVMATACQPPLSSVDMDLDGLGRTAANLLLAAILSGEDRAEPTPGRHVRPCRLVLRESTAVRPRS